MTLADLRALLDDAERRLGPDADLAVYHDGGSTLYNPQDLVLAAVRQGTYHDTVPVLVLDRVSAADAETAFDIDLDPEDHDVAEVDLQERTL